VIAYHDCNIQVGLVAGPANDVIGFQVKLAPAIDSVGTVALLTLTLAVIQTNWPAAVAVMGTVTVVPVETVV